ncbi:MAG: hypothetical protein AABP62_01260 [Planctomycetota bacterium]
MLLDNTTDPNETVYARKNGIDRSLGYLVGGVAVVLFFLLSLFGMGRVQTMSDQAVGTNRAAPEPTSAEISDSTVAEPPGSE